MATAEEHGLVVFSAILPNRFDLLEKALLHLSPEHFTSKAQKGIFKVLEKYADVTGSVLTLDALEDILRNFDAGKAELYRETFKAATEREGTEAELNWSIEQLKELALERETKTLVVDAMEILTEGRKDPTTGEVLRGQADAREHILRGISDIDRDLVSQAAPEGDLKDEYDEILEDYAERKQAKLDGTSRGIEFGIRDLDEKVGGMQKGELILIAGYSSDGKSSLSVQAAYAAAVEQGKNVAFLTTETLRPQIRRKILARHSKNPMFEIPDGLNTRDIKGGTLNSIQEEKLKEVAADLTNNPAYGRIYIAQVPRSSSISHIEQKLYRIQRQFNIDLVVMDYLALLTSDRRRQTTREELAAIMKEAKQVATTFNDGQGVPFLSPWQVSRASREAAEKVNAYTSASLSETAEATNSADLIVSIFAPTDNTSRYTDATLQILKARDGETANNLVTEVDYATCYFQSKQNIANFEPARTSPDGFFGGSSLFAL